ncbi:DNA repair protein xrcc3 [Mactra antiquata]
MSILDNLEVDDRLKASARKLKLFSYESIFYLTNPVGALSAKDVSALKQAAAKQLNVKRYTGGILCQGITEISGESASGKTQFGLQLSLTAQLPTEYGGLDSGTLYICTEDAFPSNRLYQMIKNFTSRHGNRICHHGNLGDKIFIEHVADFEGLTECLEKKADLLLKSGTIKCIVLDSVAAHFRSDYEGHEMFKRAQHISMIGSLLFKYSQQYNIPVICINQVTSSMKSEGKQLIPSLGLTWSNHVTTRIMLSRTERVVTIHQDSVQCALETVIRDMEIIYSPHLPSVTVPYIIDHEGMKGLK